MDHSTTKRSSESILGGNYPGVDWWTVSVQLSQELSHTLRFSLDSQVCRWTKFVEQYYRFVILRTSLAFGTVVQSTEKWWIASVMPSRRSCNYQSTPIWNTNPTKPHCKIDHLSVIRKYGSPKTIGRGLVLGRNAKNQNAKPFEDHGVHLRLLLETKNSKWRWCK